MSQKIKTWVELREEDNGNEHLSNMRVIARENNVYDNENLIVWFVNRFGYNYKLGYFNEWVNRYQKGTQHFISKMDTQSLNVFKEVFLK